MTIKISVYHSFSVYSSTFLEICRSTSVATNSLGVGSVCYEAE